MLIEYLTWNCEICKAKRPDEFISVISSRIKRPSDPHKAFLVQNVKYCNDRLYCIEQAKTYVMIPGYEITESDDL